MGGRSAKKARLKYASDQSLVLYLNLKYCPGLRHLPLSVKLALVENEFQKCNKQPKTHPTRLSFAEQEDPMLSTYYFRFLDRFQKPI
jgi:hypothetical protein